jgi:ParB-like chromosome segregation protein Spo0J
VPACSGPLRAVFTEKAAAMIEKKMTWRDRLSVHPAAERFDLLEGADLDAFVADIKKNGVIEAVKVMKDGDGWMVLDGRNRLNAAEQLGIEMFMPDGRPMFPGPFKAVGFASDFDPYAYVISANIHRRHLTAEKKRDLIKQLVVDNPARSDRQIAAITKSSPTTVGKVRSEIEPTVQSGQLIEMKRVGADGKARALPKPKQPKGEPPLPAAELEAQRQRDIGGLQNQTCPTTPFQRAIHRELTAATEAQTAPQLSDATMAWAQLSASASGDASFAK